MRKFFAIACVLSGCAATTAAAQDLSVSTTVGFESRYMFRGVQFAETSIQPAINLGIGGAYLNAWLNLPVGDDDFIATPGGEELDLVAGYEFSATKTISFDVGVTYYQFPDAASGFGDIFKEDGDGEGVNTIEPYVGVSFSTVLSPSLYLYRDVSLDTFTVQGSASHSIPLTDKTSIDIGGALGYVVDDEGGSDYLYGQLTSDIAYSVSDAGSIYFGARFGGSDLSGGSVIDDSIAGTFQSSGFWWGAGFSATF